MATKRQLKHAGSYKSISKPSLQQKAGESDRAYYRRLAKQANQRMVRLEDAAKAGGTFKNITSYSYAKVQHMAQNLKGGIMQQRKPGMEHRGFRFSETELSGLSNKQVERRIEILKDFLQSPTSTVQDVKTMYKKTAETFNKRYGTSFTWDTFAKYYESGLADKFKNSEAIGSDGGLEVMAVLQKTPKKVIQNLEDVDAIIRTVDDEVVQETIKEALKENKLLIQELFT